MHIVIEMKYYELKDILRQRLQERYSDIPKDDTLEMVLSQDKVTLTYKTKE